MKKRFETCGNCSDFEECQTVGRILADNPESLKKSKGVKEYVESICQRMLAGRKLQIQRW